MAAYPWSAYVWTEAIIVGMAAVSYFAWGSITAAACLVSGTLNNLIGRFWDSR